MELELDFSKKWNLVAWLPALLLILFGLGALGYFTTPAGDKVLTWAEWQVLQARRAYQSELKVLRQDAEILAGLLQGSPDVVRAQLAADQVARDTAAGQEALADERQALYEAALLVRDWAAGAVDRPEAEAALNTAIQALDEASMQ
jgi:hypothetical protein